VLVLALDTATPAVTAAVVEVLPGSERLLAGRAPVDARAHGELLAPSISAVFAGAGVGAADLEALAVGVGPGPFTGLRVGLVTAAALSDALRIPAYGVCTLDAVAGPAAAHAPAGRLLAATDARRREVYWAVYDGGSRVVGPDVARPAELAARLAELGVVAACGAGARAYADILAVPLLDADYPDPVALTALAADRLLSAAPADPLTPLYLRRPDAVVPGRPKPVTAR
jgi:tRNA threonylcarbamoyl adenosine modification protein YeaZ